MIKIELSIVEDGEVLEKDSFDGIIAVGFKEEDNENVVSRLLGQGGSASIVAGMLGAEDFIIAREIVNESTKECLEEMGLSPEDFEVINPLDE